MNEQTFAECVKASHGGLLRIITNIYFYKYTNCRPWNDPDQVYLILDSFISDDASISFADGETYSIDTLKEFHSVCVVLLIDGQPKWILVDENDVEILDEPVQPLH